MSCVAICDSAVSSEKQPLFSDMAGFSVNSGSTIHTQPKKISNMSNVDTGTISNSYNRKYVASEGSTMIVDSTVLIEKSKFKLEYEQLKVRPEPSAIDEFESLLKVYEMNTDLASLYMSNFQSIGRFNPISLEYYVDLKTEYIRGGYLYTTMGIAGVNAAQQGGCISCLCCCCETPTTRLHRVMRAGYRECITDYQTCKGFYINGAPHIKQIDTKIARVEEYLSFIDNSCC